MHTLKEQYLLIIFGPTAVGKTDYACAIANQLPAEIINMDGGQFYVPLSIGTAKPDWRSSAIPHHLFDILNEPKDFTVVAYRQQVLKTITEIWHRNKLPIIVGGSGFYLKSLFFPPVAGPSKKVSYEDLPDEQLWQELDRIDPQRAAQIHSHDRYRLKRALAIWYATGKKPSEYRPTYKPVAPFSLIYLTRERSELYARIDKRVEAMIKQGWLEEVMQLQGTAWEPFLKKKNLIGYPELFSYLEGPQTNERLAETIRRIQQKTRNYAKRQKTFWSMLEWKLVQELQKELIIAEQLPSTIETINLTLPDSTRYSIQLLTRLKKLFTG